MKYKNSSLLLILFIATTPLLSGCHKAKGQQDDPANNNKVINPAKQDGPVSVEVVVVEGIKYSEKIELPGCSVHGMETSQLYSRVGGYVKKIMEIKKEEIDIGSLVKRDMPLALIKVPELRDELTEKIAKVTEAESTVKQAAAAVKQAEALVAQKQAEVKQAISHKSEKQALLDLQKTKWQRIQGLVTEGSIGKENLDEVLYAVKAAKSSLDSVTADEAAAKANVKAAEAGETKAIADKAAAVAKSKVAEAIKNRAETMVGFATITAPFDGIITKRFVDHGAFVQPATSNSGAKPLFEISRIDKVRVVASVPNTHASRVFVNQKVTFSNIGGLQGVGVQGKITRSSNTLDKKTRMMRVDVEFTNPVQKMNSSEKIHLKPGMFGTLSVQVNEWESLPIVPVSAVLFDALQQPYVMVANGNVCQKRLVKIVFNNAKTVGIATGIKIGETVVSNGAGKLKDQQEISYQSN